MSQTGYVRYTTAQGTVPAYYRPTRPQDIARYWLSVLDYARERYGDDATCQRVFADELRALCEAVGGMDVNKSLDTER